MSADLTPDLPLPPPWAESVAHLVEPDAWRTTPFGYCSETCDMIGDGLDEAWQVEDDEVRLEAGSLSLTSDIIGGDVPLTMAGLAGAVRGFERGCLAASRG